MEELFGVLILIAFVVYVMYAVFSFWQAWVIVAIFLIWRYQEKLAMLYYSLTPHPAEAMLRERIYSNLPIDGETFALIMAEQPGNDYERKARMQQALKLAATANQVLKANMQELERMKKQALKDAEYTATQTQLLQSVEALERTQAQIDAVQSWSESNARK